MNPDRIQQIMNQQMQAYSGGLPFYMRHLEFMQWLALLWYLLIALCAVATVALLWRIAKQLSKESNQGTRQPIPSEQRPGKFQAQSDKLKSVPNDDERFRPQL